LKSKSRPTANSFYISPTFKTSGWMSEKAT
jgi:hypothetical protein